MRGLYVEPKKQTGESQHASTQEMSHKAWLDWCAHVEATATQLAELAHKAWYVHGPDSRIVYLTMMLGPFAALEQLRRQPIERAQP